MLATRSLRLFVSSQGGVLTSVMLGLQQQQLIDIPALRLCIIFGSGPSRYQPHQVPLLLNGGAVSQQQSSDRHDALAPST